MATRWHLSVDIFQHGQLLARYPVALGEPHSLPSPQDYLTFGIERAKQEIAIPKDKHGTLSAYFSTPVPNDFKTLPWYMC